jgi:rubredoxin
MRKNKNKMRKTIMVKHQQILINPPPSDARCEVCGRHKKELKTFGKAGDPLVGDFDGAYLVKNFRSMAIRGQEPYNTEGLWIKPQTTHNPHNWAILDEEKFIEKYGEKALSDYYFYDQLTSTVSASWECRDCIILDEKEYFKAIEQRYEESKIGFKIYICGCGGRYILPDDQWASRKHCDKCDEHIDLSNDDKR